MIARNRDKKYLIMLMTLITLIIIILAIRYVQYPGGFILENTAGAVSLSLSLMAIMLFNYRPASGFVIGMTAGIMETYILNNPDGAFMILASIMGLLIFSIRVRYREYKGLLRLPNKKLERLEYILYNQDISMLNIDSLYRAMMIVTIASFIISVDKDMQLTTQIPSDRMFVSIITCMPLILGIYYLMHSSDLYILAIMGHTLECVMLVQYYMLDSSDILILYQATERLIIIFTLLYSYWFSNNINER